MVTKRFQNSWKLHVSKVIEVYWDCLLLIACFSNESTSIKSREDFFTQYSTDIYVTLKKTGIASNHLTQCFLSWLPKNQGIHSGHNCSHHNHINSQEDSSEIWLEEQIKIKEMRSILCSYAHAKIVNEERLYFEISSINHVVGVWSEREVDEVLVHAKYLHEWRNGTKLDEASHIML